MMQESKSKFLSDLEREYQRKIDSCFEMIRIYDSLNKEGQRALIFYGQGLIDGGMGTKETVLP